MVRQVTLSVTLGLRDDEQLARADEPRSMKMRQKTMRILEITLSNLTEEIREGLDLAVGLEGVVVVDVVETSEAFEKGLKSGDVIVEAGQEKITSLAEFDAQVSVTIESGRKTMLLLVRRGGDPRFLALPCSNNCSRHLVKGAALGPPCLGAGRLRLLGGATGFWQQEIIQHERNILHMLSDHMAHSAFTLNAPGDSQHTSRDHGAPVTLIEFAPDDHIAHPGLILQRNENHPIGRAGSLAHQHQTGHRNPCPIWWQLQHSVGQGGGGLGPSVGRVE